MGSRHQSLHHWGPGSSTSKPAWLPEPLLHSDTQWHGHMPTSLLFLFWFRISRVKVNVTVTCCTPHLLSCLFLWVLVCAHEQVNVHMEATVNFRCLPQLQKHAVSPCNSGWDGTGYVDQAILKVLVIHLLLPPHLASTLFSLDIFILFYVYECLVPMY